MVDLFGLFQGFLPYSVAFSISLAFTIAFIVLIVSRYRNKWIKLLERDNILAARMFLVVLMVALPFVSYTSNANPSLKSALISNWWVVVIYGCFELTLLSYKYYLQRHSGLAEPYLNEVFQILVQRQDTSGGFRVSFHENSPIELWCTAQALHGLVACFNNISLVSKTSRVVTYYEKLGMHGEALWSEGENPVLLAPNAWAIISLEEIARKDGLAESLLPDTFNKATQMCARGLDRLVNLQLTNGGWAPAGKFDDDLRIFPTTIATWAISLAVKHHASLGLSAEQMTRLDSSLVRAVELLQKTYNGNENTWDNNPTRPFPRKMIGLTLIAYTALSVAETSFRAMMGKRNSIHAVRSLEKWLDNIHGPVFAHVEHCLYRDIDDAETDGPYDNVIGTATDFVIPIVFYDWIPAAMLAIYASKITGRYRGVVDALRERRLTEIVSNHSNNAYSWYTYRLAVTAIASSYNKG